MIGAIAGDIIGSTFESENHRSLYFEFFRDDCRFTDDTVIICSVYNLIKNRSLQDLTDSFVRESYAIDLKSSLLPFLTRGFGNLLYTWLVSTSIAPYNSLGNSSLLFVIPVYEYSKKNNIPLEESSKILKNILSILYIEVPSNKMPYLYLSLLYSSNKDSIISVIKEYEYITDYITLSESLPNDLSANMTLNAILYSLAMSHDYDSSIKHAISLGGDSDTIACLTGYLAEQIFSVPSQYKLMINKYFRLFDLQLLEDIL